MSSVVETELLQAAMVAAAEEMKLSLMRSAYNPVIYEGGDCATAILDKHGRLLAQASGVTVFLGTFSALIRNGLDVYGEEGFEEGDVVLTNDPFVKGTHIQDIGIYSPIFHEKTLIGFAATMAHHADVGGKSPGRSTDSTEVFQEGIRINAAKFFKAGEPDRDIASILQANSRQPDRMLGDARAQVAACRTGEKRFVEILRKRGPNETMALMEKMLDHSEELSKAALRRIPPGTYVAETCIDDDGVRVGEKIDLKIKITVTTDRMVLDLSGCPPMVAGPMNIAEPMTLSAARICYLSVTTGHVPVNDGSFRPLDVILRKPSMLAAVEPAATSNGAVLAGNIYELGWKALASAIPDRVRAGYFGDLCSRYIYGIHPNTQERFMFIAGGLGGWGATSGADGETGLKPLGSGATRDTPAEVIEMRYPIRVQRWSIVGDSGGPGKFRGGPAWEVVYEILAQEAGLSLMIDKTRCPPFGLYGGKSGVPNAAFVRHPGEAESYVLKTTNMPLRPGTTIRVRVGGGGGWGDPLERDPEKVKVDVKMGYVTLEGALNDYRVVVKPGGYEIDWDGTELVRSKRVDHES